MLDRSTSGVAVAAVIVLSTASPASWAQSNVAYPFNLPAQALAESLRTVGSQTHTNILFDPTLVDGINAQSLQASLTVDEAISRLLSGSALVARRRSTDTVLIERTGTPTPADPSTTSTDAPSSSDQELQEVVVTAEHRSADVEKTPISILTVSGDELRTAAKNTVEDVLRAVPGVEVQGTGSEGPRVFIRGIGPSPNSDPTVSMSIDDIYQSDVSSLAQFDTARVEVLRGPQGTLYGRNATGGAVNIITNDPTNTFGGSTTLQIGNYSARHVETMLNLPIDDQLLTRYAFVYNQHDGYLSNGANSADNYAGRAKLRFQPGGNFDLTVTGEIEHIGGSPDGDVTGPLSSHAFNYWYSSDQKGATDSNKQSVYARMNWNFDWAVLTFEPSYYRYVNHADNDALGFGLGGNSATSHQYTEELRLASPDSSRAQWVVGLYHLEDRSDTDPRASELAPGTYSTTSGTVDAEIDHADSRAIFGQITYPIASSFRLIGGLRYTQDRKEHAVTSEDFVTGDFVSNSPTVALSNSAVTYKAGAEYDLTSSSLLYSDVSKGYKAGGLNSAGSIPQAYRPEDLLAYEVGSKNRLFGNRLQLNADAYYYDYTNMQVFIAGPPTADNPVVSFVMTNAAKSRLWGAESDLEWLATHEDRITAVIAYNNARFQNFIYPSIFYGSPPTFILDRSGQTLPLAPSWTETLGYEHIFGLTNGASLTASFNLKETSSYNVSVEPAPDVHQPAYHQTDAHLTYSGSGGHWDATLYGSNLENTAVRVFDQYAGGHNGLMLQPPRTYGLSVTARF